MLQADQGPLVLTFDIGTQSARVILVDSQGNIVDKVKKVYEKPYYSLRPNWAEQDPQNYWDIMCSSCQELKRRHEGDWDRIIAVTCTCIRGSAVCFDENKRPVRDAILWLDKRKAENMPPMTFKTRAMFKIARLTRAIDTLRTGMYCNWLALNEPETWKKPINTDCFPPFSMCALPAFSRIPMPTSAEFFPTIPKIAAGIQRAIFIGSYI